MVGGVNGGDNIGQTKEKVMLSIRKVLAAALVPTCCLVWASGAQPGDKAGAIKFEMRLAENEPAKGLREAQVEGTTRKVYLHMEPALTNKDIAAAQATTGEDNKPAVEVRLTEVGAKKLAKLSEAHQGKPVAILLDDKVILAPLVRDSITEGKAMITGSFTKEKAEKIAKGIQGQ